MIDRNPHKRLSFKTFSQQNLEAGKVDPKLTTLARIAETIGVPHKKITDMD